MDAELMKSRIEKSIERYEKAQMRPRKNKNTWSKINRGGKRIALRKPYQYKYLKTLKEAHNANT